MKSKSNSTMSKIVFLGTSFLILMLTACGKNEIGMSVPSDAQAGDLVDMHICEYEVDDVVHTAECGNLVVQENRSDPNSRLISLPVTRVLSTSNHPAEPIFFLPGGPGISSSSGNSRANWFIDKHDVVIVGYRGVDGSVRLDCPEVSVHISNLPGDMLGEASMKKMSDAYTHCADRLQNEGVDLDGYTIVEVVDDIETARIALGNKKINLFSVSYGTRLAMIYAWRYPESIHRSAMVAVNPPGHMYYYDPAVIDQQLIHYADLCAQDTKCSNQTNNLAETIREVSQNMPERWLGLPIDHGMIRAASFESLSDTQSALKVFDVWLAAAKGDYSGMVMLSLAGPMMFSDAAVWGDNIAKAACADYEATDALRSDLDLAGSILGSPRSELAAAAQGWQINTIQNEYQQVQATDIETLLVSGSIDLWTPSQFAEDELLPSLSKGTHIVVSENGHAEMLWRQSEASARLLSSFFDTGVADDSGFIHQPWEFNVGLGFPAIAKILVIGLVLLLICLYFVIRFIIRRFHHRKP
jgi:pimeloyl-ACP methyl ester carboxylesterase